MKILRLPAFAIAALLAATSCQKENTSPGGSNTLTKIQGKWGVVSTVYDRPGTDNDETDPGLATDYVDFKTDGKVYTKYGEEEAVNPYKLLSDTKLVIDGDTTTITKLNAGEFSFSQTFTGEDSERWTVIYNLKKIGCAPQASKSM